MSDHTITLGVNGLILPIVDRLRIRRFYLPTGPFLARVNSDLTHADKSARYDAIAWVSPINHSTFRES